MLDEKEIAFPNPRLANGDGLLAAGGDLSVERLLLAFLRGRQLSFFSGRQLLPF